MAYKSWLKKGLVTEFQGLNDKDYKKKLYKLYQQ